MGLSGLKGLSGLSTKEVPLSPLATDVKAYWKFDDSLVDSTGNGNDGTGLNDPGYTTGIIGNEVGFWHRLLTDEEIAILYNGGAGNTYPFLS